MKIVAGRLPNILQPLFWDVDFSALDWHTDRDFMIRRILQSGGWQAIQWLRSVLGDEALRLWLEAHAGGRLNPRQLRYWQLMLDLPENLVEPWILKAKTSPWERRLSR